jgi:hypothetical protein
MPSQRIRQALSALSAHFAGAGSHLRSAVVATAAMLLSFGSGLLLERLAHLNVDIVFLTVVLSLTLARQQRGRIRRQRIVGLAVLPAIAVAAGEVGQVMVRHQDLGDAMFVAAISGGIWLRRFGPVATRAGTLIALPFITLMVTPVPAPPSGAAPWWGAVATLVALAWSWGTEELATRIGFLKRDEASDGGALKSGGRTPPVPSPAPSSEPMAAPEPAPKSATTPTDAANPASAPTPKPSPTAAPKPRKRLTPSDRMGLQMAIALTSAFALGRWLFPHHWTWMVLTAFIVSSGNRGRGDVVHKSLLRFGGAATGTVVAALLAGLFRPHDPAAVVVIFVALSAATWLRNFSYAYWAGCVTAVLSILYGYFGEKASSLLPTRLEEIVLGALLAVAAAWFVVPIRTADVVRGRLAEALAALSEVLGAARSDPAQVAVQQARFEHAVGRLDEVARPVMTHRRVVRRTGPHPADALESIRGCVGSVGRLAVVAAEEPSVLAEPAANKLIGRTALAVGEARRTLARRPVGEAAVPKQRAVGGTLHTEVQEATAAIIEAMEVVQHVYAIPVPAASAEATAVPELTEPAPGAARELAMPAAEAGHG